MALVNELPIRLRGNNRALSELNLHLTPDDVTQRPSQFELAATLLS